MALSTMPADYETIIHCLNVTGSGKHLNKIEYVVKIIHVMENLKRFIGKLKGICGEETYSSPHYAWNCANLVPTRRKRSIMLEVMRCLHANESVEVALVTGAFIQHLAWNLSFVLNDFKEQVDNRRWASGAQQEQGQYDQISGALRNSIWKRFELRQLFIQEQFLIQNLESYYDSKARNYTDRIEQIAKIFLCPNEI